MIVKPLKNSIQATLLILLVLTVFLWFSSFMFVHTPSQEQITYKEHVFYHFIFDRDLSFFTSQLLLLLLIVLGAVLTNFLSINQEITTKTNYLPAFFYILISFASTTHGKIEPLLVANIFILPAFYFLINSYRKEDALTDVFNSALCIGIASFFCIHYLIIIPVQFIALIILRSFNWREWAVSIIGIITPLYFYICIQYLLTGVLFEGFAMIKEALYSLQIPALSQYYIALISVFIFTLLLALVNYLNKGFASKVKTQKSKLVLLWMLFFCFLILFFEQATDMILLPCAIPLSIILGDYISQIKNIKTANLLLTLFLLSFLVIYFNMLQIF
jgi:hypothetical protein